MQNKSSTCGYGLSSQVGYLFERQRSAMRQNSFARARNVVAKRKSRDEETSDEDEQLHKKVLLEGIKRMRMSSPTSVDSTTSRTSASACSMTDFAMDGDSTEATAKALVPVAKQPRRLNARRVPLATKWSPVGAGYCSSSSSNSDMGMPPPTDASCTALVLFDPTSSIPRGPSPRIELVDSDEEQDERRARRSVSDDDDDEPFIRFEEIHDDDEPMEID
jgi:hypothetical protein